jgi:hypothetical protein
MSLAEYVDGRGRLPGATRICDGSPPESRSFRLGLGARPTVDCSPRGPGREMGGRANPSRSQPVDVCALA